MLAVGSLTEVFDAAAVARLAGPVVYSRGEAYFRNRRVESPDVGGGRLEATVRGTMPYVVELWADGRRPRWSCTCPAAEDGSFCKHAVAAALSLGSGGDPPVLAPRAETGRSPGPATGRGSLPDADELAVFVGGLARERLAEIVLERAGSDWRLRERLLAEARAARGVGADVAGWRRRIDRAFGPGGFASHGFVAYSEAPAWAAGVDEVIDALEDLCDAGHHDAAAGLAEHAHRCADRAIDYVDDSDGWLTGFSERLSDLHLRACEAGPPDPTDLAARLVELELGSELVGFGHCAAAYATILGEAGLAAFRERLESHRERIGPDEGDGSVDAFAVHHAMVGWALGTGDPDALIEVHSRGRPGPHDVLQIAQALDRAGRADEAIAWARRAMSDWGGRPWQVDKLREFLAAKLRDRGDEGAAVRLYWQAFVSGPSLSAYRRLGVEDEGQDWLRRCVDELRSSLARAARAGSPTLATPEAAFASPPAAVPSAAVALVDILLYEGRTDAAWDAANEFGCRAQTWLTLARAREQGRPLDAVAVYESAALAIIERKDAKQYESAVDLMARVRRLADAAGEPDLFMSLLGRVRTEHRAKRKLKALLDAKGW